MSRFAICLLAAAALGAAATVQAGPIGTGVGPNNAYTGHAWFTHPSGAGGGLTGFTAAGPTLAECQAVFNADMATYLGDGYVLNSFVGCRSTPLFSGMVAAGQGSLGLLPGISFPQLQQVLTAESVLRQRYRIDAYEAELQRLYSQEPDGRR